MDNMTVTDWLIAIPAIWLGFALLKAGFTYLNDREMHGILALLAYLFMAASFGAAYLLHLLQYGWVPITIFIVLAIFMLGLFLNRIEKLGDF